MTNVNEDMMWKIFAQRRRRKLRCHIPSAIFTSFSIHCVIYFIFSPLPWFRFHFKVFPKWKITSFKKQAERRRWRWRTKRELYNCEVFKCGFEIYMAEYLSRIFLPRQHFNWIKIGFSTPSIPLKCQKQYFGKRRKYCDTISDGGWRKCLILCLDYFSVNKRRD